MNQVIMGILVDIIIEIMKSDDFKAGVAEILGGVRDLILNILEDLVPKDQVVFSAKLHKQMIVAGLTEPIA